MVADPIKAELTKTRPEEGRTDQIGGLRLGARAGRPPLGSVRSGEARTPPIKAELTKTRPEEGRTDQIGGLRLGARAGRPPLGSVRSGEARTPPIKAEFTKSRPEEGRTDQIEARAGRPPLGSVRSGEAEAPPIRTHHRAASTTTVQTQSRNMRTQRRAVRGSADHADKAIAPSYRSHCSSHQLYRWRHGEPQSYPGSTGLRAPADRRLTAGSSSMYLPLYPGFSL